MRSVVIAREGAARRRITKLARLGIGTLGGVGAFLRYARFAAGPRGHAFRAAWPIIHAAPGLLIAGQERWLFDRASALKPRATIVEIGAFRGRSTLALAAGAAYSGAHVFSIDTFDGNEVDFTGPGRRAFFNDWQTRVVGSPFAPFVTPVVGRSQDVGVFWRLPINFLFIDASHVYEDVRADFELFFPHVVSGGGVALHDVDTHDGPTRVWREVKHRFIKQERCASIAFGERS